MTRRIAPSPSMIYGNGANILVAGFPPVPDASVGDFVRIVRARMDFSDIARQSGVYRVYICWSVRFWFEPVTSFTARRLPSAAISVCRRARQEPAEESPNDDIRFRRSDRRRQYRHSLGYLGRSSAAVPARTGGAGGNRAGIRLADRACSSPDVVIAGRGAAIHWNRPQRSRNTSAKINISRTFSLAHLDVG
jgi:hypothetical protein